MALASADDRISAWGFYSPFFVFNGSVLVVWCYKRLGLTVVFAGIQVVAGKQSQLETIIEPIVTSLEYSLWGIDFVSRGRESLLRIYIDSEAGISLDDCVKVSRQVSAALDVEDPIADEYTLEVSSPGVDRPLFKLEQYDMMAGSMANIRLRMPFEGRRKFRGVIKGVEDQDVILVADGHEFLLPIEVIEKAQIIPQFD